MQYKKKLIRECNKQSSRGQLKQKNFFYIFEKSILRNFLYIFFFSFSSVFYFVNMFGEEKILIFHA